MHETMDAKQVLAEARKIKNSSLERRFSELWESLYPQYKLMREYRFYPPRDWKLDFYHSKSDVAVEVHGGEEFRARRHDQPITRGRHTRGKGFIEDRRKMNTAAWMDIIVFELTDEMINPEELKMIADAIEGRR